ncbi:type III restriction-modification system endonuclease [Ignatzschineria indica]|uniref:type III restriction-modification system endonuclease n=1 Tax=Ignatzschineria indica TaxID=472583 RepID=UPI00257578B0|nr:type III restriction-modification system endonuclease [Ignatzschineria indica]MDM1545383.1 type III restriction-modification system endonuclease [Ignatzschineria indica]
MANQNKGFNFERNLYHQEQAVNAVKHVFTNALSSHDDERFKDLMNPTIEISSIEFTNNLIGIQTANQINHNDYNFRKNGSKILDISMETGTGKTYTYTKTMFELNRDLGVFKFIIIVPTRSIRAGTMSFLNSDACKDHFKQEYDKEIKPFVLESQRRSRGKKNFMPQAISNFVSAQDNGRNVYVLIINSGMLNSPTMEEAFDRNIIDRLDTCIPFDAIATIKPITIIDEPHKFPKDGETQKKINKLCSQYILRYGATFNNEYENLLYELTAVDAFNQDLVKGITTYVEDFDLEEHVTIKLISNDSQKATFELNNYSNSKKKATRYTLSQGEKLSQIHPQMSEVYIEKLSSRPIRKVALSNGLDLTVGSVINPYSYSESLQDRMLNKAITNHFKLEKKLLTRDVKIKPLTLFFIDDIEGYREEKEGNIGGELKSKVEDLILANAKKLLATEDNPFYKEYLQKTINNVEKTHGGYFSKDNTGDDEKVSQEVEEILHDKERLLSLDNPRRFIFSKWTLKEGWDNPNVFQICKLRSSGSETSKLQEVGRGLRLPVNQYMSRVKDESFDLNYYVDFTEKDFAQKLVNEINEKSNCLNIEAIEKITDDIVERILKAYPEQYADEDSVYEALDEMNIIKRSNTFKEGGFELFKAHFAKIFESGLKPNKVKDGNKAKERVTIRTEKYHELKKLWEALNQKVILEYKFDDENHVKKLLKSFFIERLDQFKPQGIKTTIGKIKAEGNQVVFEENILAEQDFMPISTMTYSQFLLNLSTRIKINKNTLHHVFCDLLNLEENPIDINLYLSEATIRTIYAGFSDFLLKNAISDFKIDYQQVSNRIHPTAFTDTKGNVLSNIDSANIGRLKEDGLAPDNYFFDEIFFDSEIEKENIKAHLQEIIVYTKIPKNSIKIPVAGGGTYSPDFAYVLKYKDGKEQLNLVIESKGAKKEDLRESEKNKIAHAELLFQSLSWGKDIKIKFRTQFESQKITDIIRSSLDTSL